MRPVGAWVSFVALGAAVAGATQAQLRITHGVAAGDVTSRAVVLWARANGPGELVVELDRDPSFPRPRTRRAANSVATDYAAQVELRGLDPATRYHYRAHFEGADGASSATESGSFGTAPAPDADAAVSFVVGGDLGGQGYCRDAETGYPIFQAMAELEPDFFVANGDMIYADGTCPGEGPQGYRNVPGDFAAVTDPGVDWTDFEAVREVYLRHWRYNRADPHFRRFLAKTPLYVQWDDHEVVNDFGAPWPVWSWAAQRRGYPNLVRAGRQTLFAFHPLRRHPDEADRLYRSVRWGRHVELFLLDARSYRSSNELPDLPHHDKTLLGEAQLTWLEESLIASDATWKVVSSDVPLAAPTGSRADLYGRDAWANGTLDDFSSRTGFESELLKLLAALDRANLKNLVFLATDVHFAANLRYELDADGDGDPLVLHELISGPLKAGRAPTPAQFDPTLSPTLLYGEGNLFNFSHIRVVRGQDGKVHLVGRVLDTKGEVRPGSRLDLVER